MVSIAIVYSIPIVKVYRRKTSPEMTPRSPNMIIIYLCFLLLDSLMNTYLFALNKPQCRTILVCYLGVFCTVVCQFGIMTMVFLRMFRIYSVFSAYEDYLKWQKLNILNDPSIQVERQTATDYLKFQHLTPKSVISSADTANNLRNSMRFRVDQDKSSDSSFDNSIKK